MRILHLLSQIEVTGAEVYAVQLANLQLENGNIVWIMSDSLHTANYADYISIPLHQRSLLNRWKNVKIIRQFIKENQIDIIHAHSRASSWVGYFACLGLKIPLIASIHGNQRFSLSKRFWNFYGDRLVPVCGNLAQQLFNEKFKFNRSKLIVSPNGLRFPTLTYTPPSTPCIMIAGRTTGPKGKIIGHIIQQILPDLLATHPNLQIKLIGGDIRHLATSVKNMLVDLQTHYPNRIQIKGFVTQLAEEIVQVSGVIASGRIAIETLALGVPLCAVGEASCIGVATEANLPLLLNSNFGDIGAYYKNPPINFSDVKEAISDLLTQTHAPTVVVNKIREFYDINRTYQEIMHIYRSARIEKQHSKHIPILMYHKVLPAPENTRHKTFITQKQFFNHMHHLAKKNYTPINFKQYFDFFDGNRPLSEFPKKPIILTFDDAYINNIDYALPILKEFNFTAVLYALGNHTIQTNYWDSQHGEPEHQLMSADQLKLMHDAGIEIGAHSLNHLNLTKLSEAEAFKEILESKVNLEKLLNCDVISFAYPYGYYNDQIKTLTTQAGFRCAVATDTGGLRLEDDYFAIFRVNIMPRDNGFAFWKKIQSWYRDRYFRKRGH